MTAEQIDLATDGEAVKIQAGIQEFLAQQIKADVAVDHDLFGSGLVSSMFAMQLVVHLEEAYDIAIIGPELKLDNFRTVAAMSALVLRLRAAGDGSS